MSKNALPFLDAQSFQLGWNFWSQSKMRTWERLLYDGYSCSMSNLTTTTVVEIGGSTTNKNPHSVTPSPKLTAKACENRPYLKREVIFLLLLFQRLWLFHVKFQCVQGSVPCRKQTWQWASTHSNSKYIYFLKDHLLVSLREKSRPGTWCLYEPGRGARSVKIVVAHLLFLWNPASEIAGLAKTIGPPSKRLIEKKGETKS